MSSKKKIFCFLFLSLFVCNGIKAQDSTRKSSYFKNDSVLFKKFNLAMGVAFQIPRGQKPWLGSAEVPAEEGLDDYTFYKPGNISYGKGTTFNASVAVNFKIRKKLYATIGVNWSAYNTNINVWSDSLFYKNQVELYSVTAENKGHLINLPLLFQYRINKYFYPFVGYSFNAIALTKRTIRDSEKEFPTYSTTGTFVSKHNQKIIGFDFNIPKARRLYFTFKFIYTGNKWNVNNKDLWYSFGLKYYII